MASARTDISLDAMTNSPWFRALPSVGYDGSVLASTMESIGDYYASQLVCRCSSCLTHAINRGIAVGASAASWLDCGGRGGTTSYSGTCAALGVTSTPRVGLGLFKLL
ncbi:solute carrier family 23 member 2 [Lates japonicus]|uniref:Solute carrier family 23 member 2 n=1 Tax=Lates japonicus TaxID=270547 RepID=A0AAD3MXF3_LATJO|nr:solute carrier family 23 member 2 [Lates japonicus]